MIPKESSELRLMVDDMKGMIRGLSKDMSKKMGTLNTPMNTKEQMAAYIQYKGMNGKEQAKVRKDMDNKHGVGESVIWEREMQSRLDKSMMKKVKPFEEVS